MMKNIFTKTPYKGLRVNTPTVLASFVNKFLAVSIAILFTILIGSCVLEPDAGIPVSKDGIVIYSGSVVLNSKTYEIVTNRVQQLRAACPSGHNVKWSSDNEHAVYIDPNNGRIRSGQSPNQIAVITAVSVLDSSLRAEVIFKTKGLR